MTKPIVVIEGTKGGTKIYASEKGRDIARAQFIKGGANYINYFKDANGYGLQYGLADWVKPGDVHFQR